MKKLITTTIITLFSTLALAAAPTQISLGDALLEQQKPGKMPADNPCTKVNLTDAQKATLKEMMLNAEDTRIQDEANVKKAMLASYRTLIRLDSTKDEGKASQDAALSALSTYSQNMATLELNIMYDVLQPEQREPAIMCAKFMKSHGKKGRGGHH